jgi:hypothetical protein
VAGMTGQAKAPFWEGWSQLKQDYEQRLPA